MGRVGLIPGLRSLRGRYIFVATLFGVFLLGAALLGERLIEGAAGQSIGDIQLRHRVAELTRRTVLSVNRLETRLERFLTLPSAQARESVRRAYARMGEDATALATHSRIAASTRHAARIRRLGDDILALKDPIERLLFIRSDIDHWIPATRIRRERMLPANMAFYTAATLALDEAYALRAQSGQQGVFKLFADTRHAWTLMVGEFRLRVADRFGVSGAELEASIQARVARALRAEAKGREAASIPPTRTNEDGPTQLYNRAYFQSELERVVERSRHTHSHTWALLYIDLLQGFHIARPEPMG